jgi:hypothetical protein
VTRATTTQPALASQVPVATRTGVPIADPSDGYLRYLDTLRTLAGRGLLVRDALLDAYVAASIAAETAALRNLHRHLRDMAGIVNTALAARDDCPGTR